MLKLVRTLNSDYRLRERMIHHYSQPKGLIGRQLIYAIYFEEIYYGHIVGGSCTKHLPGRKDFFSDVDFSDVKNLNRFISNTFFNISKVNDKYPMRNFTSEVIKLWEKQTIIDWYEEYGDKVLGFETLVEPPRDGSLYLKAGWSIVGETKGITCKRITKEKAIELGLKLDSYGTSRLWDSGNPRPKLVLCKRNNFYPDIWEKSKPVQETLF